jgi:uncharacterized Fe-S cluster-containing radical SAM superfamily protein
MKSSTSLFTFSSLTSFLGGHVPGQVVIQLTDRCNARCAQCGMRVTSPFSRSTLSMERIRKIVDTMAERNMQAVSFTGGEPFLVRNRLMDCLKYAGRKHIRFIRTGTNGYMFCNHASPGFADAMHDLAARLAATKVRNVWISLDSCDPDLHEQNRGLPGMVEGLTRALPIFHEHGIFPSANLGINRLTGGDPEELAPGQPQDVLQAGFERSFERFFSFSGELGFTIVNCCYPMSMEDASQAVYAATSAETMIRFTAKEKVAMFTALYNILPRFRSRMRLFTPRSSLLGLIDQYKGRPLSSAPCRGGLDFFFIDTKSGHVFPCGYRADEDLGPLEDLDFSSLPKTPFCRACDWECFRDPSEMTFPLTELMRHPMNICSKMVRDAHYRRVFLEDIRYYKACGYFNGREDMDRKLLEKNGEKWKRRETVES